MKKIIFLIFLFASTVSKAQTQGFIPIDGMLHFSAGYIVSTSVNGLLTKKGVKHSQYYGLAAGVAAGVAKELHDQHSYGVFSSSDLYYTAFGAFLGTIVFQVAIEAVEDRERKRKPNPLFY